MNQVLVPPEMTPQTAAAHLPLELAQLMLVLKDCLHPRAQRLQLQIQTLESIDQITLRQIQADARHVLRMSFGEHEASRRLNVASDALQ